MIDIRSRREKIITDISVVLVLCLALYGLFYASFIWNPNSIGKDTPVIVSNFETDIEEELVGEELVPISLTCCDYESGWVNRVWDKKSKCVRWCEG